MLAKQITYTDYNGRVRTEEFLFNMTKAELMEMELGTTGGWTEMIERIIKTENQPEIIKIFKQLILKAYGVKSDDGKRFIKSQELSDAFSQTEAYSELFMELATNSNAAADFINGITPSDIDINDVDVTQKFPNLQINNVDTPEQVLSTVSEQ